MRVVADDPVLVQACRQLYRDWARAPADGDSREVRIRIHGRAGRGNPEKEVRVRFDGRRLVLRGAGVRGCAAVVPGQADCYLSPDWFRNPARLKDAVLDTLILFLLARRDRVPLHAAALGLGRTAAILAGTPGVGKSTLALEGARSGMRLMSEDTVFVQTGGSGRVWGWPGQVHLDPVDADRSGERVVHTRVRGGHRKVAVDPCLDTENVQYVARRSGLFLLTRDDGPAGLEELSVEAATREIVDSLEPGFDVFRGSMPTAVAVAARDGCWRLRLDGNPAAAVQRLKAVLQRA